MEQPAPWPVDPQGPSTTWRRIFQPGQQIVVSERWHGLLWGAEPHTVVRHTPDLLVTAVPRGSAFVVATNRDLDYTEGMSRDERKRAAMATRRFRVREHLHEWTSLHVFVPSQWAQVWFSWDEHDAAIGHYVNFQSPALLTADGLESKDLVLDALVRGDDWSWKDEDDFADALHRGLFPPWTRDRLLATAATLQDDLRTRRGAFDPVWCTSPPAYPPAPLPPEYRADGERWRPTDA